jgi:hypothetical protein
VSPGQILVLQWSVHSLPELTAGEVVSGSPTPPASATPSPTNTPQARDPTQPLGSAERELEAMLGLQPGRLQSI